MDAAVRAEQPGLLTARNLYAQVALNPEAETWYAQSLRKSIQEETIFWKPVVERAGLVLPPRHDLLDDVGAFACGWARALTIAPLAMTCALAAYTMGDLVLAAADAGGVERAARQPAHQRHAAPGLDLAERRRQHQILRYRRSR